jgi:hypothetical protein
VEPRPAIGANAGSSGDLSREGNFGADLKRSCLGTCGRVEIRWGSQQEEMTMSTDIQATDVRTCLDHLCQAMNSHDMEAFLQCFHPTYASDQPAHPNRRFSGHAQVRKNWQAIFTRVSDCQAEYCVRSRQTTCCGPSGAGTGRGRMGARLRCVGSPCGG